MAIEKNGYKVSQFDSDCSPGSRDIMSTDEDEIQFRTSAVESDEDDEFDDVDSGAGSDDFDLLELGETGAEFCQVGNQTCSIPFELYDLSSLEDVLSVDVWNENLTEEERFGLTKFLPDMDQETYMLTLMELFKGCNFNFGSPLNKLFGMLKGGLCEPRVALYREGLNSFEMRQHYHLLKKHQNQMVTNLCQIRDAWHACRGYSIEEKLRVLNIVKNQKSWMWEKNIESDSSGREDLGERLWSRRNKERNLGHPMGSSSVYNNVDLNWESPMALDSIKSARLKSKRTVKMGSSKTPSGRQLVSGLPTLYHGTDLKPSSYNSVAATADHSKAARLGTDATLNLRDQMRGYKDVEDPMYGVGPRRDQIISRGIVLKKSSNSKPGKNHEYWKNNESYPDSFVGLPLSLKGSLHVYGGGITNQVFDRKTLSAKPPTVRTAGVYSKKALFPENSNNFRAEGPTRSSKSRLRQLQTIGNQGDKSDLSESFVHEWTEGQALSMDGQFDNSNRSKKWKKDEEGSDVNQRSLTLQMDEEIFTSDVKRNFSSEKSRVGSKKNRLPPMGVTGSRMFVTGDVTESDTSSSYDDEDSNPLIRSKSTYPTGFTERPHAFCKPELDSKKGKSVKKDKKENAHSSDGPSQGYRKMDDLGDHLYLAENEKYPPIKGKKNKKNRMHENPCVQTSAGGMDSTALYDIGDEDESQSYKILKNGPLKGGASENSQISSPNISCKGSKQQGEVNPGNFIQDANADSINEILQADDNKMKKHGKKGKNIEKVKGDFRDATVPNRRPATKKRKKDEVLLVVDEDLKLRGDLQHHNDDPIASRKRTKKNMKVDARAPDDEASNLPIIDSGVTDMELEKNPPRKVFTPITPTVHTGFSFSIIHLLSAVRIAMITHLPDDSFGVGKDLKDSNRKHDGGIDGTSSQRSADGDSSENAAEGNNPSLTIQEIVDRVRSNPGDPCILETQEPLQDLVRGVLKILSSRTAPLGAKGWKTLVVYQKSRKGWSWIGPVLGCTSDQDTIEEVTSPEAWALPHKMLVKLVDSFANWLKSSQETLQQIGSLPPPPMALMQFNLEEKDRFRDLKAQKSLSTIIPSVDEVRSYFQKEELLRYSIPDRAFSYTAADGKKSVVAPLRRSSGKPTSKARDHFMLKRDRPPHVTILCLVRDAASRLPGSIGTRADVCTLIRDSQYIVEDVSDAQVNQVVSGALDRLHYERDPCVQFDPERKLWKYLHREKEEEDFEDDGTSSTKKWKRPKKEAADPFDEVGVTVAYHGAQEEPSAFDLCSDLNFEPASVDDGKVPDRTSDDCRLNEGDMNNGIETPGGTQQEQPVVWSSFELNPPHESKIFCQENSTNEDFDDETLGRDRSGGILSTDLF